MKEVVLMSKALQTDDTPVPVLDREFDPHAHRADLDVCGRSPRPYIVYDYTGNRSREDRRSSCKGTAVLLAGGRLCRL